MQCNAFIKQCFVVVGVALNLAQFGLVIGFSALLLPQLKKDDSEILIDEATGSWIAAIPSLSLLIGNIIIPVLMGKIGRKFANLTSIIIIIVGWMSIIFSTSVSFLLAARCLQGISLGMSISSSPVSIAEYTSPKWRGSFLTSLSIIMSLGALFIHTITAFITWKSAAIVCTVITFVDLFIVACSPETPSWLANQGRYEDCQKVFRWLRCDDEEDELSKLIEANKILKNRNLHTKKSDLRTKMNINSLVGLVKKKEFCKPIFIATHMYIMAAVCGINILSAYTVDVLSGIVELTDVNIPLVVISLDIQRLSINSAAVYLVKRFKRRTVLFWSGFWNVLAFFLTSGYILLRSKSMLPFDNSLIGILLLHFIIFSSSIGTFPVPLIVCGEIFSMKYRSISSSITSVLLSICLFTIMKTFPLLNISIGLTGSFFLYGGLLFYCLMIAYFCLPETKDKTLQDIENEFKGQNTIMDEQSAHSLMLPQT